MAHSDEGNGTLSALFHKSGEISVYDRCRTNDGQNSNTRREFRQRYFALDIDALRKQFFDEYGVLSNSFDIYKGDPSQYSCSIVIERSDPAQERYRLKFRNSLGVFEIIELAGELTITPDYAAADEARFSRYDAETDDFTADRERITRPQSLTIETGLCGLIPSVSSWI